MYIVILYERFIGILFRDESQTVTVRLSPSGMDKEAARPARASALAFFILNTCCMSNCVNPSTNFFAACGMRFGLRTSNVSFIWLTTNSESPYTSKDIATLPARLASLLSVFCHVVGAWFGQDVGVDAGVSPGTTTVRMLEARVKAGTVYWLLYV